MNRHGLTHPRMMAVLQPNFYPSSCTIATPSTVQDDYGEQEGVLTPVAGLVGLDCRIAPMSSREQRTAQQIYATATHHVALNGYYPAITTTAMSAQVDGVQYDIEGVEHDGNDQMTRLLVRRVA